MSAADTITMLHCHFGRAVKTFKADGTVLPYRAGKLFTWTQLECASLVAMLPILRAAEYEPNSFPIRGVPRDTASSGRAVLRRANGPDAAFCDGCHHWMMLDIDGAPAPAGVDPTSDDALGHVVSLLPAEFQGVSFIAQWSSSAGMKPSEIKVHLWFWLETPHTSAQLRSWARSLPRLPNGKRLIDPAVYNSVQPHYTARPIFEGMSDPLPIRTMHVQLDRDSVPDLALLESPIRASSGAPSTATAGGTIRMPTGDPEDAPLVVVTSSSGKIVDGREQWLRNARYRTLCELKPSQLNEFVTLVWDEFREACETGQTSASANAYTRQSVMDKCHYDWEKFQRGEFDFQQTPSLVLRPFPDRTVPLADGIAQLRRILQDYLSNPKHTAIRVTSGAGKTATLCDELVKELQKARVSGKRKVAHFYLSTHELKGEIAYRLQKLDPSLRITNVIGRVPDTCERYELTSSLRDLRISIQRSCCDASSSIDRTIPLFLEQRRCPHFKECSYQGQFQGKADIYLFTKHYLSAGRRTDVAEPDWVIIDESFVSNLLEIREAGLEEILELPETVTADARKAVRIIRDSLANDEPILGKLRDANFDMAMLKRCAFDINQARLKIAHRILPGMQSAQIAEQAKNIGAEHVAYLALQAIAYEIGAKRADSYSVAYQNSRLFVRLLREGPALRTPTLVLDATADEELIRAVLPNVQYHAIEVPRRAHVVQVQNRRLSKYSLTKDQSKDRLVSLVQRSLNRISAYYPNGLLVTFKDTESLFMVPKTWEVAHFGNIRGIDRYKGLDVVVIVGTYLPPVQAVETEAAGLAARLPEARAFSGAYARMERPFRLRHGETRASIWGHPDPFVQRVLEQKREAEMLQAVDRLRLVHSPSVKPVFILSNVPLDLTIDETVTLEQLAGEDDLVGQLLDHFGGAIPLRASLLHEHRPDLFSTEKAAEKWAGPFTPRGLISTIRPGGVKELRAKGVGQKGPNPTRVLVRGDHPAPRSLAWISTEPD